MDYATGNQLETVTGFTGKKNVVEILRMMS